MARVLIVLVILVPIIEIWGIATVGNWIGGLPTLGLLLLSGLLGWYYARREGLQTLGIIRIRLEHRELPGDEVIDGLLILMGGILLILPGFFTDILGLLMVFPYTRSVIRLLIKQQLMKRVAKGAVTWRIRRK